MILFKQKGYLLKDKDGKVIEKFRNLRVCQASKKEWEKFTDEELEIEEYLL